jgi:ATP-binding cassette subfamily B protein
LGVVVFITIAQIAELSIPILIGLTIDQILEALESGDFKITIVMGGVLLIVLMSIIRGLTAFLARWLGYVQGEKIVFEIRKDLFLKYETASLSFFDKHHTGDLMARATTDLEPISEFMVWGERILLQATLTYIGIYSVLFLIDIRLFIMIGIVTPALFVLSYFVSTKLGPLYFEIRNQYGQLTTVIQENISGQQVVKAFNAETREKMRFDEENFGYMNLRAYAFKIRSIFLPMILLIISLLITVLIYSGGTLVIADEISTGFLITLFTYFTMLAMPTRFLAFSLIMYQRVSAAGDRIFRLLESQDNLPEIENALNVTDTSSPSITFENVSFSYTEKPALRNISLKIYPGEKVAILGSTGSGKSTSSGVIKINDIDIRNLQLQSLRKLIGFVHQEPFLFGRTISENIAFGVPNTGKDNISEVVEISQLSEFIESLPNGLDTIIGERGVTLSGGQKQRVAIARMLLRHHPIMILDDATSSLDIVTENNFQESFESFVKKSTKKHIVIFITQRLSTLKIVDRIVILHRGQIFEQGTHADLMKNGKIYPLLWQTVNIQILSYLGV